MSKQKESPTIAYLLKILYEETDAEHPLSRNKIKSMLSEEYKIEVEEKTVGRNLSKLAACEDLNVKRYKEVTRSLQKRDNPAQPGECAVTYGYYMDVNRKFTDTELLLLIDGLLFSQHIEQSERKNLIEKLKQLGSKSFNLQTGDIIAAPMNIDNNQQVFRNTELLGEAIHANKKVVFQYASYNMLQELIPRTNEEGSVKEYRVSPYHIVAREGKYYLLGNQDDTEDRIHIYRLDRILNLEISDQKCTPQGKMKDLRGKPWNLSKYMNAHPYMVFGDLVDVNFEVPKKNIIDVLDTFGNDVHFWGETEETVCVETKTAEDVIIQFAKRYAPKVIILKPQKLRDRFLEDMKTALTNHGVTQLEKSVSEDS